METQLPGCVGASNAGFERSLHGSWSAGIDAGYLLHLAVAYQHEEVASLLLDPPSHIRAILLHPASQPDPTSVLDGEGSSLSAAEEASFQVGWGIAGPQWPTLLHLAVCHLRADMQPPCVQGRSMVVDVMQSTGLLHHINSYPHLLFYTLCRRAAMTRCTMSACWMRRWQMLCAVATWPSYACWCWPELTLPASAAPLAYLSCIRSTWLLSGREAGGDAALARWAADAEPAAHPCARGPNASQAQPRRPSVPPCRFPLLHKLDALRSFWETPVILALREGHDDIVTWLLKRASPLPVPDDLNRTALVSWQGAGAGAWWGYSA